jgi:hypothetical protein
MDYHLYLPGNWEVIYGKQKMQQLMGALRAPMRSLEILLK